MASPLSANTFFTPRLRMITFSFFLTSRPNPSRMALASLPMIEVLLPTLTWSAALLIVPLTYTTFLSSLLTAEVKAAYEETVVVVPPDPPVVPPFRLA